MKIKALIHKSSSKSQVKAAGTLSIKKHIDTSGLPLYDRRMLELMDFIISTPSYHTTTKAQFLSSISFPSTNLNSVKRGIQSFRTGNILNACQVYGVDARFFFDEKHLVMFAEGGKLSPIMILKQAVVMVENALKSK